jgi:hypothetical protein
MSQTVAAKRPGLESGAESRTVKRLLLVSAAFLLFQVINTDYDPDPGESSAAPAVLWFVVGCVLLRLVYSKRSRVARGLVVITSFWGAGIFAFGTFESLHYVILTISFLGQGLPLVSRPVRDHVQLATARA